MVSDNTTAYIVSIGEYSDYRVRAVFTERQLAQNFATSYGGSVEEFPLNPPSPVPPEGMTRFRLDIYQEEQHDRWDPTRTPYTIRVHEISDNGYAIDLGEYDSCVVEAKHGWRTCVWARDRQHAAKIGNEYRSRLLTGNMAYEPVPTGDERDWDIWLEGHAGPKDFGENFPAEFIGTFHGTWEGACRQAAASQGWSEGPGKFELNRFGPGVHTYWALRLYDNEVDARKANG